MLDDLRTLLESTPTSVHQLREKLRARLLLAGGPTRLVSEAELLEELLRDVDGLVGAQDGEWLDFEAASHASGYSTKQLKRLADEGRVETTGTHRNRRFRRGSLPMKRALRDRTTTADEATKPVPSASAVRPSPALPSTPAPAQASPPSTRPVAVRRGHTYDPTADAQRFAQLGSSMRNRL